MPGTRPASHLSTSATEASGHFVYSWPDGRHIPRIRTESSEAVSRAPGRAGTSRTAYLLQGPATGGFGLPWNDQGDQGRRARRAASDRRRNDDSGKKGPNRKLLLRHDNVHLETRSSFCAGIETSASRSPGRPTREAHSGPHRDPVGTHSMAPPGTPGIHLCPSGQERRSTRPFSPTTRLPPQQVVSTTRDNHHQ